MAPTTALLATQQSRYELLRGGQRSYSSVAASGGGCRRGGEYVYPVAAQCRDSNLTRIAVRAAPSRWMLRAGDSLACGCRHPRAEEHARWCWPRCTWTRSHRNGRGRSEGGRTARNAAISCFRFLRPVPLVLPFRSRSGLTGIMPPRCRHWAAGHWRDCGHSVRRRRWRAIRIWYRYGAAATDHYCVCHLAMPRG